MIYPELKIMNLIVMWEIKILKEKENKEFGTKKRKTLCGKKINKIKVRNKKKAKKPIKNGKRNLN